MIASANGKLNNGAVFAHSHAFHPSWLEKVNEKGNHIDGGGLARGVARDDDARTPFDTFHLSTPRHRPALRREQRYQTPKIRTIPTICPGRELCLTRAQPGHYAQRGHQRNRRGGPCRCPSHHSPRCSSLQVPWGTFILVPSDRMLGYGLFRSSGGCVGAPGRLLLAYPSVTW